MRIRVKRFSRLSEGLKGAMKGASLGILGFTAFMPGSKIAFLAKRHKLGLGLLAVEAGIGATIGALYGYKSSVDDYDKLRDPREFTKLLKEQKKNDDFVAHDFSLARWKKANEYFGGRIPKDFLNYVKFYETKWANRVADWYRDAKPGKDVPSFLSYFPAPFNPETAMEWHSMDDSSNLLGEVALLECNSNSTRFGSYSLESGTYGNGSVKTIEDFLTVKSTKDLTKTQIGLVGEFNRALKSL